MEPAIFLHFSELGPGVDSTITWIGLSAVQMTMPHGCFEKLPRELVGCQGREWGLSARNLENLEASKGFLKDSGLCRFEDF